MSVHAAQDLALSPDQAELSIIVLPALDGDGSGDSPGISDQDRGAEIAVRWSGELPVHLQPGIEDAAGRWQARGEPIELTQPMTLMAPADKASNTVFRILDTAGTILAT